MPRMIVTDKLRSYAAAKCEILPGVEHRQNRYLRVGAWIYQPIAIVESYGSGLRASTAVIVDLWRYPFTNAHPQGINLWRSVGAAVHSPALCGSAVSGFKSA